MKIYVSHSTNFDYQAELYGPLREHFSEQILFLPHEKSTETMDSKNTIKDADMVLAEVSYPSTGQGIELGWANDAGVPIICIHREDAKHSGALEIVSDKLISYSSTDDLVSKLRKFI